MGMGCTMSRGCPSCGSPHYSKAKVDPNSIVITRPRVCGECHERYTAPLPRWVGLLACAAAVVVLGWMLIDAFAPPQAWAMRFTWTGRVGMTLLAGMLIWMGTRVLRGLT